jgi:hypothetical protein
MLDTSAPAIAGAGRFYLENRAEAAFFSVVPQLQNLQTGIDPVL